MLASGVIDPEETSDCESASLDHEEPVTYGCDTESESETEYSNEDNTYITPSLESVPDFTPVVSLFPTHHAAHRMPNAMNKESASAFFKLLVTDTDFQLVAINTNTYARAETAATGRTPYQGKQSFPWQPKSSRPWYETTDRELMVWFGLLIFMALVKTGAKNSGWIPIGELMENTHLNRWPIWKLSDSHS